MLVLSVQYTAQGSNFIQTGLNLQNEFLWRNPGQKNKTKKSLQWPQSNQIMTLAPPTVNKQKCPFQINMADRVSSDKNKASPFCWVRARGSNLKAIKCICLLFLFKGAADIAQKPEDGCLKTNRSWPKTCQFCVPPQPPICPIWYCPNHGAKKNKTVPQVMYLKHT